MRRVIGPDIIVSYLSGEPAELADRAAAIIDVEEGLLVPPVAIAHAAATMVDRFRAPHQVVSDLLMEFMQKENVSPLGLDKDHILQALLRCRTDGASFYDAMVSACARSAGVPCVEFDGSRAPESAV